VIALPIELHQRLAYAALGKRWSMAEAGRQAIAEWVERNAKG
jgi:hypothetical protein